MNRTGYGGTSYQNQQSQGGGTTASMRTRKQLGLRIETSNMGTSYPTTQQQQQQQQQQPISATTKQLLSLIAAMPAEQKRKHLEQLQQSQSQHQPVVDWQQKTQQAELQAKTLQLNRLKQQLRLQQQQQQQQQQQRLKYASPQLMTPKDYDLSFKSKSLWGDSTSTPDGTEILPPFFDMDEFYNDRTPTGESPRTPIIGNVYPMKKGFGSLAPFSAMKETFAYNPLPVVSSSTAATAATATGSLYKQFAGMPSNRQGVYNSEAAAAAVRRASQPLAFTPLSVPPAPSPLPKKKPAHADDQVAALRPWDASNLRPQPSDFKFAIKPARKSVEHFLGDIPGQAYSHPYKYDLRSYLSPSLAQTHVVEYRLFVERSNRYVTTNAKDKNAMRIECTTDRYANAPVGFNSHRVVFQVCSFHYQRSHFQLHVVAVPKPGSSGSESLLFRSSSFELFARKVKPDQWPSNLSDGKEVSFELLHKKNRSEGGAPTKRRRTRVSQALHEAPVMDREDTEEDDQTRRTTRRRRTRYPRGHL